MGAYCHTTTHADAAQAEEYPLNTSALAVNAKSMFLRMSNMRLYIHHSLMKQCIVIGTFAVLAIVTASILIGTANAEIITINPMNAGVEGKWYGMFNSNNSYNPSWNISDIQSYTAMEHLIPVGNDQYYRTSYADSYYSYSSGTADFDGFVAVNMSLTNCTYIDGVILNTRSYGYNYGRFIGLYNFSSGNYDVLTSAYLSGWYELNHTLTPDEMTHYVYHDSVTLKVNVAMWTSSVAYDRIYPDYMTLTLDGGFIPNPTEFDDIMTVIEVQGGTIDMLISYILLSLILTMLLLVILLTHIHTEQDEEDETYD